MARNERWYRVEVTTGLGTLQEDTYWITLQAGNEEYAKWAAEESCRRNGHQAFRVNRVELDV